MKKYLLPLGLFITAIHISSCSNIVNIDEQSNIQMEIFLEPNKDVFSLEEAIPIKLNIRIQNNTNEKVYIERIVSLPATITILKKYFFGYYVDVTEWMFYEFFYQPSRKYPMDEPKPNRSTKIYPDSLNKIIDEIEFEKDDNYNAFFLKKWLEDVYKFRFYLDPGEVYEDFLYINGLYGVGRGTYKIYCGYTPQKAPWTDGIAPRDIASKYHIDLEALEQEYKLWKSGFRSNEIKIKIK